MGITSKQELDTEALRVFDGLVESVRKSRDSQEIIATSLLFKLLEMNSNNRSKKFFESAKYIERDRAIPLMEQGLVQQISSEGLEKYALTFRGIAHCVNRKYGISFEDQFIKFLELSDRKSTSSVQIPLTWQEKLATMSLILMGSTSESSALRIDNESNKRTLNELFGVVLECLKKYRVVEGTAKLKTIHRGESPASALMSRVNDLPRKTNHYYKILGRGSCYFFDIEEKRLDEVKLELLFRKVFEHGYPDSKYTELGNELVDISDRFAPQFLGRKIDPVVTLSIKRKLREFMDVGVLRLPLRS